MSEKRAGVLARVAARLWDLLRAWWGTRRVSPALETGEEVLFEGDVVLRHSMWGPVVGPLMLTNRRLIWYERPITVRLKPMHGEVRLSDVEAVDRGKLIDRILWCNKSIHLHLRGGKRKRLVLGGDDRDEWMEAIRKAIAKQN